MQNQMKKMAIVYDWMDKQGGVERMLVVLHEMFPDAVFYTSVYDEGRAPWARAMIIKTSFMQRLPGFIKRSRFLSLPFFPFAFESFNFNTYDVVISVTSSFAKTIVTKPHTKHICILLTPPRFLWSHTDNYLSSRWAKIVAAPFITQMREYDFIAARRPDRLLAISKLVSNRCKKYYGLEAKVVYPPFDDAYWKKIKNKLQRDTTLPADFFLVVSRLESYKKIELAIQACNELKKNLIVVGSGSRKNQLHQMAGPTITFMKNVSDERLGTIYSQAQALIMPQEEDFGYTALEAQYFSCPVISYINSGATETLIDGQTGIFFNNQTKESLKDAIEQFTPMSYNRRTKNSAKSPKINAAFSVTRFKQQIARYLVN